jgi:hypothetical protein
MSHAFSQIRICVHRVKFHSQGSVQSSMFLSSLLRNESAKIFVISESFVQRIGLNCSPELEG